MPEVTKLIYNVELGKEVEYVLTVDENNEILAKAENGDFLKFPNVGEEQIDELIVKHNAESQTQVKKQPLFGQPVEEAPIEEPGEPVVS